MLLAACHGGAQDFTQRGFLETRGDVYPRQAPGDSGNFVGDLLLRYEAIYKFSPALRFSGALDARTDTHRQTGRDASVSWQDRTMQRPAIAIRRLNLTYTRKGVTLDLGKQFIRWGKTDILNPTDRFAPRDFLTVFDNDFLAVTAARVMLEHGSDTLDAVFVPRFTPSRTPLFGQRWIGIFDGTPPNLRLTDAGAQYPGGPQTGLRWSHTGRGYESSLAFYEGFNHLPLFGSRLVSLDPLQVELRRYYPKLRMYGGDLAMPLAWFTVKGEAAYFTTSGSRPDQPRADEYVQYVLQLERLWGEWVFVGGYAGQAITRRNASLDFAPDRGFTKAFLGRAGYTIDANRSFAMDAVVRQNGEGLWVRFEYSQAFGQHWRATGGYTFVHGASSDFLGRFQRNSHASLILRYSW